MVGGDVLAKPLGETARGAVVCRGIGPGGARLQRRHGSPFIVVDEVPKVPALLDAVHWLMENRGVNFALCVLLVGGGGGGVFASGAGERNGS